MMSVNRISQINLAAAQANGVLKILKALQAATDDKRRHVLYKELGSSSSNLAATLNARREFTSPSGNHAFDIDPRFMLFEFCHNILLRKPQVDLICKLVSELKAGKSVCHQMIMGAGKTTVIGPLLVMLMADMSTLMVEVLC